MRSVRYGLFLSVATILIFQVLSESMVYNRLWEEIQKVVTPNNPQNSDNEYFNSPEVFIMNSPGTSIDYEAFDMATWKNNSYEGPDPDLLRFELTDSIPARSSVFIDSGRRVSSMYKRFLMTYINPTSINSTLSEETETYKAALLKIFTIENNGTSYNTSDLVKTVDSARETASEMFDKIASIREQCLQSESASICAQKVLFQRAAIDDQIFNYIILRKELQGAKANIFSLQTRNLDNIITQSTQKFLAGARSSIGNTTLLQPYMLTRYDPSDFHQWWNPDANTVSKTYKAAWTGVSVYHKSGTVKYSNNMARRAFGGSGSIESDMFSVNTALTSSTSKESTESQTIKIAFKLAQVRVYRQWFDPSLFEYYPLGMDSTGVNEWSDGNYKGTFPWFISKVIVAKDVSITFDQFTSQMTKALSEMQTDASLSANYGPFKMSGSVAHQYQKSRKSESFSTSSNSITITGPQIIGYVATRMHAFPNYAEEESATTANKPETF